MQYSYSILRVAKDIKEFKKMKNRLFLSVFLLLNIQSEAVLAFCCNGDGCPYSLATYVNDKGIPTGRYSLIYNADQAKITEEGGTKLNLVRDATCSCKEDYGFIFPSNACPHCVDPRCPNPACGHSIFQHACDLDIRTKPGTGIIKIREKR